MAYARGRRAGHADNFWPGYVDILSTLLLTTIFLMSLFMVAQFFVSQQSSGKDVALKKLSRQLAELTDLLSLEKGKERQVTDELSSVQASLSASGSEAKRLQGLIALEGDKTGAAETKATQLKTDLDKQITLSSEAQATVDLLNQQLLALRRQMAALESALTASESKEDRRAHV